MRRRRSLIAIVVGAVGIEPTLPKEQDFKSCVSAISPRARSGNNFLLISYPYSHSANPYTGCFMKNSSLDLV